MPVIRFYSSLRTIANRPALDLDSASFPTLRAVLAKLTLLYPEMDPYLLDDDGNLRREVPIFINGRNPRLQSTTTDRMLMSEDVISIFTPIASGKMNVEVLRDEEELIP
jgi:molybdopterin converting factor small subunit